MNSIFYYLILILKFYGKIQATGHNFERILSADIKSLTFKKNELTSGLSPTLQLQCIGGSYGCNLETPEKITCQNIGVAHDNTILWDCKGDSPKNSILGQTVVNCECYSQIIDDPYIIKDSCSLKYSLEFIVIPASTKISPNLATTIYIVNTGLIDMSTLLAIIFGILALLLFLALLAALLRCCLYKCLEKKSKYIATSQIDSDAHLVYNPPITAISTDQNQTQAESNVIETRTVYYPVTYMPTVSTTVETNETVEEYGINRINNPLRAHASEFETTRRYHHPQLTKSSEYELKRVHHPTHIESSEFETTRVYQPQYSEYENKQAHRPENNQSSDIHINRVYRPMHTKSEIIEITEKISK